MNERLRVYGRVQGVGFRAHTRGIAQTHGLAGWANNCADGSVDILLVGDSAAIHEAKAAIIQGPRHARVERIQALEAPADAPTHDFTIG